MITVTVANPAICRRSRGEARRQRTISDATVVSQPRPTTVDQKTTRTDPKWSGSRSHSPASRFRSMRPRRRAGPSRASRQRSIGVELRQYRQERGGSGRRAGRRRPEWAACRRRYLHPVEPGRCHGVTISPFLPGCHGMRSRIGRNRGLHHCSTAARVSPRQLRGAVLSDSGAAEHC